MLTRGGNSSSFLVTNPNQPTYFFATGLCQKGVILAVNDNNTWGAFREAALSTPATFVDHRVTVAPGGQLTFGPNNITAKSNDTITFIFSQMNHTATEGSSLSPCQPLEGGFDSGL